MKNIVFPSQGFVKTVLEESSIDCLVAEIDSLDKSRQPEIDHSHVGVIEQEYRIVEDASRVQLADALMPCVEFEFVSNGHRLKVRLTLQTFLKHF